MYSGPRLALRERIPPTQTTDSIGDLVHWRIGLIVPCVCYPRALKRSSRATVARMVPLSAHVA